MWTTSPDITPKYGLDVAKIRRYSDLEDAVNIINKTRMDTVAMKA
jgi:hypothetical protein